MDLSHWQVAYTGAEPVRAETLQRFAEAFKSCGFRADSFLPCFGLAESSLMVTCAKSRALIPTQTVRRAALEHGHAEIAPASEAPNRIQTLVSSGFSRALHRTLIVNPDTFQVCNPGEVGEIWSAGPSIAKGYWGKPVESEATFRARLRTDATGQVLAHDTTEFLRTGDLGYLSEGEVFVTGRLKDLIIIRGRNYYPQDLEAAVQKAHPSLRQGFGTVFSVDDQGEEKLVVLQELEFRQDPNADEVFQSIVKMLSDEFEVAPWTICLLKPGKSRLLRAANSSVGKAVASFKMASWKSKRPGKTVC